MCIVVSYISKNIIFLPVNQRSDTPVGKSEVRNWLWAKNGNIASTWWFILSVLCFVQQIWIVIEQSGFNNWKYVCLTILMTFPRAHTQTKTHLMQNILHGSNFQISYLLVCPPKSSCCSCWVSKGLIRGKVIEVLGKTKYINLSVIKIRFAGKHRKTFKVDRNYDCGLNLK